MRDEELKLGMQFCSVFSQTGRVEYREELLKLDAEICIIDVVLQILKVNKIGAFECTLKQHIESEMF